jgi:TetR/AcrR family transcriptional repressor of nem operon
MKVTREQAAANREKVLTVAGQLFRERGFDGVSVVDLMNGAGLTHGGFYSQFKSKDALAQEVCSRAIADSMEKWRRTAEAAEDPLAGILDFYLSPAHRNSVRNGCPFVAFGNDAQRKKGAVQHILSEGLEGLISNLAGFLPGDTPEARRSKALVTVAEMMGGLVLSRLMEDEAQALQLLDAVRDDLAVRMRSASAEDEQDPHAGHIQDNNQH